MQMHLPLNDIDAQNNPPLWFLWIQDGMNLACGALWSTAYVLYIRQSFRDKSYGMPLLSLSVEPTLGCPSPPSNICMQLRKYRLGNHLRGLLPAWLGRNNRFPALGVY